VSALRSNSSAFVAEDGCRAKPMLALTDHRAHAVNYRELQRINAVRWVEAHTLIT
jgi:hypothetical protein